MEVTLYQKIAKVFVSLVVALNHGQTAEPTQQNLNNADDEVLAEFMPFVTLKNKTKKYIPINQ